MGFQQHLTFLQCHALERHFFVECSIVDTTQVVASGCEVNIVNVIGNRECSKKYPVTISWRWDMGYVGTKASLIKNPECRDPSGIFFRPAKREVEDGSVGGALYR